MPNDRERATPLAGRCVAITADRKGEELRHSLERLGAEVLWGPTLRAVPPEVDELIEAETAALLAADPQWFAASTGNGLRAWLAAAERTGRADAVIALLRRTQVVARGAKSHGALRAIGVEPVFVSSRETMDDVCFWLAERVRPDEQLGVQVHGGEVIGTLDDLRARLAAVITVAPYRWVLPDDLGPATEVVEAIVAGRVDVLAQTSAPSARNLFAVAASMSRTPDVLRALKETVCVAAVGPVTARAFEEVGVAVDLMPHRARTADLLRAIVDWAGRP
ncbi:MAG TPA: uroporphyrinogen-III synthase [Jatrophihabitans sp.]|nr:uroporphyrinogen-III synthase [Jatrophihabitans sp.]